MTIVFLIVYTILCGPLWRLYVSRWTTHDRTMAIWTSAAIVSSFIVVLTGVSMLVAVFVPQVLSNCTMLHLAFGTSFYVAFEYIWHDELESAAQVVVYGLPFGLPFNIAFGLLAGAALGLVADFLGSSRANDEVCDALTTFRKFFSIGVDASQKTDPDDKGLEIDPGHTRQLLTAQRIAVAALLIAIGLWAWRHDWQATLFATRGTTICVAIGFFGYLYVRCLAAVVRGNRPSFRVTDLFAVSAAAVLLAAAGFPGDAVTIVILILYAILCGPLWRRFVSRWTTRELTTSVWTSAAILTSFIVVLSVGSMLVVILAPRSFQSFASINRALALNFYVSFEHILHDEADTTAQLLLYGLAFGLPLNIGVGLLAGAALGLVPHFLSSPHAND